MAELAERLVSDGVSLYLKIMGGRGLFPSSDPCGSSNLSGYTLTLRGKSNLNLNLPKVSFRNKKTQNNKREGVSVQ